MQPLALSSLRQTLDDNYVLVLTTNSHERKAINAQLSPFAKIAAPIEHEGCRLGLCAGRFVLHLTGTSGGQSDKSIGWITRALLKNANLPRPNLVLVNGIAWGNPALTQIGDTILSGELLAINHLRLQADHLDFRAQQRTSSLATHTAKIGDLLSVAGIMPAPHQGVLASAELFVMNPQPRDMILDRHPTLLGGEMEAWNLVGEIDGLPWLQVRAISDYGEGQSTPTNQEAAAFAASALLAPVLNALQSLEELPPPRQDNNVAILVSLLEGKTVEITAPSDKLGLNDHLNDRIGPPLAWRLAQYAMEDGDLSLARYLAALLLEMSQNALKHGGAQRARITFHDRSVTYEDDGQPFDLFSLTGDQGGAEALTEFITGFVKTGIAEFSVAAKTPSDANRYTFKFPSLETRLKEARENCAIEINYGHIGRYSVASRDMISFNQSCDWLYFDTTTQIMPSRRIEMNHIFVELLSEGKGLFIACYSDIERNYYERRLQDYAGDRLRIFVAPRRSP